MRRRGGRQSSTRPCRPASAKSGRPPPPPPTIGASSLTSRPAWTRLVRSFETDTTSDTLPSTLGGEDDDAAAEPVAQRIGQAAQRALLEALDAPRHELDAGDVEPRRRPSGARRCRLRASSERRLHLELVDFAREPLALGLQPLHGVDALRGGRVQRRQDALERLRAAAAPTRRLRRRSRASMRRTPAATPLSSVDDERGRCRRSRARACRRRAPC